ncbi:MAG: hypothetical protein CSA62_14695 [Planctomycetota bacterium]|nr:MAG: hypothetical protein CSA62_14695 [Planctomycetota bacterium]
MTDEYIPFEKALEELQMSEDELKRLVSDAEIQAVRNDGEIRLRRADIEALRDRGEVVEDLVFADDGLETDETGMVTAVLEEDSLLEEEDTLDLDSDDLVIEERSPLRSSAEASVRSRGRAASIRDDNKEEGHESGLDIALMVATTVVLIFAYFVAMDISQASATPLTDWLANMFPGPGK